MTEKKMVKININSSSVTLQTRKMISSYLIRSLQKYQIKKITWNGDLLF